jgi:hypothetical protein
MGYVEISDDLLWTKNIQGDSDLRDRIAKLPAGATIDLEIDGVVGNWEKARVGRDGRPTAAIKPIGPMREVWKRFQQRRGEIVDIRETRTADGFLKALNGTLSEWNSPEDEEAFRDL